MKKLSNVFILVVLVSGIAFAEEKFVEECIPSGVVKQVTVGSEGTIKFKLDSDSEKTYTVPASKSCQHQMFLQMLLKAIDSGKLICLLEEEGKVIAMDYNVAKPLLKKRFDKINYPSLSNEVPTVPKNKKTH